MGGRAGGGASAGMGSGSRGMASSLRNIESSIRNLPVEHAYVLDANDKVLDHLVGDEGSVEGNWDRFSDKGITITHNHPEDASFSNTDVWTGIRLNAKEIRATANGHTYSLKPGKNGWGIPRGSLGALKFSAEHMGYSGDYRATWQKTLIKKAKAGDKDVMTFVHSQLLKGQHYAISKMAKQYGWTYKVTKN